MGRRRGVRVGWGVGALAVTALGACLDGGGATPCDDGVVCSSTQVCAPAGGGCVDPAQVEACAGRDDGAACNLPGIGDGLCRASVCVVAGCGDGTVDVGEACDDGNDVDDDACTSACALPTCGDGAVQGAEACDDGAANGDDRACTTRCLAAACGDNLVLAGVEACDAGAGNADDDACTTACARNACGDGRVFAGVEACDDGNTDDGDGCRADCGKVEVCGDALVDAAEACDDGDGNPANGCDACVATTWTAEAVIGGAAGGAGISARPNLARDRAGNVYVADRANCRILRADATTGALTTIAGTTACGLGGDGGDAGVARLNYPSGVAVDGLGNVFVADTGNGRIRKIDGTTGIITTIVASVSAAPAPRAHPVPRVERDARGFAATTPPRRLHAPPQAPRRDAASTGAAQPPATLASELVVLQGIAVDGLGNLYFADTWGNRVRRRDGQTGVVTTVAGGGATNADGIPATSADLGFVSGITLGPDGDLYLVETIDARVRRVDAATGLISTVAGTGTGGDGGPATSALLSYPQGVAVAADGTIYITEDSANRVRRVDVTTGVITTLAGTGVAGFSGDGGPAASAELARAFGIVVDADGDVFVGDSDNHRIRRIDVATGSISTFAGDGSAGTSIDGTAGTSANYMFADGLTVDPAGGLLFADEGGHSVRRLDPGGTLTRVAGRGDTGFSGDGGLALGAKLSYPSGTVFDAAGNLLIADADNHRIRKVDAVTGVISTIAGSGAVGYPNGGFAGDGGLATAAQFNYPGTLALAPDGDLYVVDGQNNRIRRIDAATGIITTEVGSGATGLGADGVLAHLTALAGPAALLIEPGTGDLYFAESSANRVRKIDASSGVVSTVVGVGSYGYGAGGYAGDGGLATAARLRRPAGIAMDTAGNLYVSDTDNNRIRRVDRATGIIQTIAGGGPLYPSYGDGGDGGPAITASLARPEGLALASDDVLYVADIGNQRIRRIDLVSGIITTVVGPVAPPGLGPAALARFADPRALVSAGEFTLVAGGSSGTVQALRPASAWLEVVAGRYPQPSAIANLAKFRAATFGDVGGVAWDAAAGRIYLAESSRHQLHVVTPVDPADEDTWIIAPLAGAGDVAGFADGALAAARFRTPTGLFFDEAERVLYVADAGNHVVRALDLDAGTTSTIAGTPATLGFYGDGLAAADALLYQPQAITRCAATGDLFIADTGNHRVRRVAATTGLISTVLGDGVAASSGEGSPAATFPVDSPLGLACDPVGNLLVTSTATVRLLPAAIAAGATTGIVDGTGPVVTIYGGPPRATFPAAVTSCLTGVAVVDATTAWVTDACTGMVVELWRQPAP